MNGAAMLVELADELGLRRLDRRSVASGYLLTT
jgi:hypothetical protein